LVICTMHAKQTHISILLVLRGRRGRDSMVVYNYLCNRCQSPLMSWVRLPLRSRSTTLCDKVCLWLATGRWFSPGPPASSTNKTDRHDIPEILLKVALKTIKPKPNQSYPLTFVWCFSVLSQLVQYNDSMAFMTSLFP
jgi:hypothetical protein